MSWDVSCNTVDGRTPAPVEVGSLSHYSQGSMHPWWSGFLPSTVVPENWWSLYSKARPLKSSTSVKRVKVLVHFLLKRFGSSWRATSFPTQFLQVSEISREIHAGCANIGGS